MVFDARKCASHLPRTHVHIALCSYVGQDGAALVVSSIPQPLGPGMNVVIDSTDYAHTLNTALAIGEVAIFNVTATLMEGNLPHCNISVSLPVPAVGKMIALGGRVAFIGSNVVSPHLLLNAAPLLVDSDADGVADSFLFQFRQINNTADNFVDGMQRGKACSVWLKGISLVSLMQPRMILWCNVRRGC